MSAAFWRVLGVVVLATGLVGSSLFVSRLSDPGAPERPGARDKPAGGPYAALRGAVIGIDPAHNGRNHLAPQVISRLVWDGRGRKPCNTTGTESNDGYAEAAFTFALATELRRLLRGAGATVVLTRADNDGVGPCVDARARIINRANADVAIDLHADGGPASGRGFAVLLPVPSGVNDAVVGASRRYARILRGELLATGMPRSDYLGSRGLVRRGDLAGLNLTKVPQVILECGNMRNAVDARLQQSPRFRHQVAQAIARAMARFLAS